MEQNEQKPESIKEMFRRPIKSVSIDEIEKAFAKALSDLTRGDYEVDIQSLNLSPDNQWHADDSLMNLKISKRVSLDDSPFGTSKD